MGKVKQYLLEEGDQGSSGPDLSEHLNTTRRNKIVCVYTRDIPEVSTDPDANGIVYRKHCVTVIGLDRQQFNPVAPQYHSQKAMVDATAQWWSTFTGWPIKRIGHIRE